jgi:ABC-type transport system involved in Fe-S cluster assembly fused permease/ATPase subunit
MKFDTGLIFNIVWKAIVLIFVAGGLYMQMLGMRTDLARMEKMFERLETKVEKHNNFDRRIVKLETLLEVKEAQK